MSDNEEGGGPEDFDLADPYKPFDDFTIYADDKRRGKAFGVYNDKNDEELVRLLSKSKKPHGTKANTGFNVYSALQIDRLFNSLRQIARALGWDTQETKKIENLQEELKEKDRTIANLRDSMEERDRILRELQREQAEYLKSRIKEFQDTLEDLEEKIGKAQEEEIPEKELQNFLTENTWLFGAEYASSEPKKMRGASNEFDFYLERYSGVNDVVEIKKISDDILRQDGKIGAKVIQAVDQCIDYMEETQAAAHSTVISDEEGIDELRPRGRIIIGYTDADNVKEKLEKWNYRLNNIRILTYRDILEKAENTVEKIKKEEDNDG